jgi:hypothetical protein
MDAVASNASFAHLTGEEIAADVVKASALKEGSYNEVYESQESANRKKLLSSAGDGADAVINYVVSSTSSELHLRIVREM